MRPFFIMLKSIGIDWWKLRMKHLYVLIILVCFGGWKHYNGGLDSAKPSVFLYYGNLDATRNEGNGKLFDDEVEKANLEWPQINK
ncbi:hypothetical protein LINPERHAP1_LOCUS32559 [Linum perenne]